MQTYAPTHFGSPHRVVCESFSAPLSLPLHRERDWPSLFSCSVCQTSCSWMSPPLVGREGGTDGGREGGREGASDGRQLCKVICVQANASE